MTIWSVQKNITIGVAWVVLPPVACLTYLRSLLRVSHNVPWLAIDAYTITRDTLLATISQFNPSKAVVPPVRVLLSSVTYGCSDLRFIQLSIPYSSISHLMQPERIVSHASEGRQYPFAMLQIFNAWPQIRMLYLHTTICSQPSDQEDTTRILARSRSITSYIPYFSLSRRNYLPANPTCEYHPQPLTSSTIACLGS